MFLPIKKIFQYITQKIILLFFIKILILELFQCSMIKIIFNQIIMNNIRALLHPMNIFTIQNHIKFIKEKLVLNTMNQILSPMIVSQEAINTNITVVNLLKSSFVFLLLILEPLDLLILIKLAKTT